MEKLSNEEILGDCFQNKGVHPDGLEEGAPQALRKLGQALGRASWLTQS